MAKKKKPILTPDERARFAETMRLLEARIAYHEQKARDEKRADGA